MRLSCLIQFQHRGHLPCGVKIVFPFCERAKMHMLPVTHIPHATRSVSCGSFCPTYHCLNTTVCLFCWVFFLLQKHFYEEAYTFLSGFFVLIVSSQVGHWEFGIAWFYTVSNTVAVFCLNMLKHLLLILSFSWCLYCVIYFSMFNSVCIFFLLFPAALDFLNSQNSD